MNTNKTKYLIGWGIACIQLCFPIVSSLIFVGRNYKVNHICNQVNYCTEGVFFMLLMIYLSQIAHFIPVLYHIG